jgi:ketosteroid isomerase-like protein
MTSDFAAFMKFRADAAASIANGETEHLDKSVTHTDPATFFSPLGGAVTGAAEVKSRYESDAKMFDSGGESRLEVLHMDAAGDLAYWTGFQRGTLKFRGKPDPTPQNLRITEVFRRIDGEWKMIHRHADPLAEERAPAGWR